MHRVCLALLLLFSLRPLPVAAGPAVGEADRWLAVVEHAKQAVLGTDAAELHEWARQAAPDGSAPLTALPPPSLSRLARMPDVLRPPARVPGATTPCGPQHLPYYATAPPRSA